MEWLESGLSLSFATGVKNQMGIMSHKAPIGIFFHTLKTEDENSPLEPKWGFYCLERVPGK